MTVEDICTALIGGVPRNLVNPEVLKNRRGD